ncbi:hypothetical protein E2320_011665 [Naja naja]|nr:hypothetical protein E2320_011665 [Naja naja]
MSFVPRKTGDEDGIDTVKAPELPEEFETHRERFLGKPSRKSSVTITPLRPSRIARQHAFRQRAQSEGESISMYMVGLRMAALQCSFKELDDMLLDQLVCGVRDLRLQRCLLAKGDLTLKMAIKEAQAAEMSNLSAAEIQGVTSSPAAKPNATIHFEEFTPDEFLDYGEDINRLTNHQQLQQQRGWNLGNKPQQFPTVQRVSNGD